MSSLGWHSVLPLDLGGDPSPAERAFNYLRRAIGEGASPVDATGIEQLRQECIAIGLSCIAEFDERATLQYFPNLAIDAIPWFEELLKIAPPPNALIQERREEITRKFVELVSSEIPNLQTRLTELDPRLVVQNIPWEKAITVQPGRAFQKYRFNLSDTDDTEDFNLGPTGSRTWTEFPMFSSHEVVVILYDLGSGVAPGRTERKIISQVRELLTDALPSFEDFQIITEVGFIAGVSLTGYGGAES